MGYFSIVPVPARTPAPGPSALATLPFIGAVLGGTAGVAGWLVARTTASRTLGAASAYGTLAVMTGAIHLDGFLDGCDAFFASVPRERRLEILDDPRHGSFAVAGMFVAGSLAVSALAALPPRRLPWALGFAAGVARASAVIGAFVLPGARRTDARRPHYPAAAGPALAIGIGLGALGGSALFTDVRAAALVPLCAAGSLGTQRWICTRIGGLVGDAYGFTIVVGECATLVLLAALAKGR